MFATVLLLAACVGLSSAETVQVFGLPAEQIVVSSIDSDATATTWLVGCPVTMATDECFFAGAVTYTLGPSTMQFTLPAAIDVTGKYSCKIEGMTSAACGISYYGPSATGSDWETYSVTTSGDLQTLFVPATIVTDAASIQYASGIPTDIATDSTYGNPLVSSTAVEGSPSSSQAPAVTSGPTTVSSSNDPSATSVTSVESSSSSTAGMPRITGYSGWAVGGVAAAIALAAL